MAVVPGANRYCGPFAVGYCADVSPDVLADGPMTPLEIYNMLQHGFGIECVITLNTYNRAAIDRPTIAAWARDRKDARYLIMTKDHVAVVDGDWLYDNNNRQGVKLSQYNHRRDRIVFVLEVPLKRRLAA